MDWIEELNPKFIIKKSVKYYIQKDSQPVLGKSFSK